jgi:hypothetical protein
LKERDLHFRKCFLEEAPYLKSATRNSQWPSGAFAERLGLGEERHFAAHDRLGHSAD